MSQAMESKSDWIGRKSSAEETLHGDRIAGLAALLDSDNIEASVDRPLPPTGHWLYFNKPAPQKELGADGHPVKGGFLPPVALPRRMRAGSRIQYLRTLRIGEHVKKITKILNVTEKTGRNGALTLLTLSHTYEGRFGTSLIEEQDIIYREMSRTKEARSHVPAPDHGQKIGSTSVDEIMLFRYSALTFNSHRIHYDRPYTEDIEGYPGLVVHGPLTATLIAEAFRARHPEAKINTYEYRAISPLFCGDEISVFADKNSDGNSYDVWAASEIGGLAMRGTIMTGE